MAAAAAVLAACNGGAARADVIEIAADGIPDRRSDEGVATSARMNLSSFRPNDSGLSAAAVKAPEGLPPEPSGTICKAQPPLLAFA